MGRELKMTDQPTLFKDMTEDEQKEILFARLHGKPLEYFNGRDWLNLSKHIPSELDLYTAYRLKPEKRRGAVYVNIYPCSAMTAYESKADAERVSSPDRLALVKAEWVEGQIDD
jgi:hypothetical protein